MREVNFVQAINEAIREEMRRDETVFLMGEDVELGYFRYTSGLVEEFGQERVRNTPLAENSIVGAAVGAAAAGMRPIVDIMMFSFSYLAMDQIVNQASKMRCMFGGQIKLPMVIYGMSGGRAAAQHSDNPYGMFMNVPGLKIVVPSDPCDAKGLLKAAIRDDNPVLFFLNSRGGGTGNIPDEDFTIPLGVADVKLEGKDVTVVAIGSMVEKALAAAKELIKDGISLEVVDLRTLVPMDKQAIVDSVKKTGRMVIADDAPGTCGASAEIAAVIVEDDDAFGSLDAPIQRVTRQPVHVPFSTPLANFVIPDASKIKAAVHKVLQ